MPAFSWCSECGAAKTVTDIGSPTRKGGFEFPAPGTRHHILMTSNEVPLDSDVAIIESAISKTDAPLACLNDEIARLQFRLEQLKAERDCLSTYRTKNHAILSPVRRIPSEVLGEIFSWAMPLPEDVYRCRRFQIADSPWLLTHICRHWRAVSVSDPSLWSLITIYYDPGMNPSSSYSVPMLETQIARAQNLKIHLHGREGCDSQLQAEIFHCLSKHSSRWEELRLTLTSAIFPLLDNVQGRVPILRSLWIQWDDEEIETAAESVDFVETAPSLVDVSIFSVSVPMSISLPVGHLTRYQLDGPWEMHRGILALGPNLVEARISVKYQDDPWLTEGEVIHLAALARLYVSQPEVLPYIRAPALQELALFFPYTDRLFIMPKLQTFLSRSSCTTLYRLCLSGCSDAETTIKILQNIPSITELRIILTTPDLCTGVKELMDKLTISDVGVPGPPLVPALSGIFFGSTCSGLFDFTAYLKMVQSRWNRRDCALSHTALLMELGPDCETLDDLEALRRDGLEFHSFTQEDALTHMASWIYSRRNA
ncbi:F-box domain-containing protein [Mycena venus]|uniref:F-box domain-containing protein n=1 Tax=Mycena venus TaxID=2733690 RepID=A0A8H7CPP4_9AGAR|nr:F-box domain-containing protein [Mycena venus]